MKCPYAYLGDLIKTVKCMHFILFNFSFGFELGIEKYDNHQYLVNSWKSYF